VLRGKNAFSVNLFEEYLVHEMHKEIQRDFCTQKAWTQIQFAREGKWGKTFSHLLTFIIIQNGIFMHEYSFLSLDFASPACSTFSVAAQLLSGHLLVSFAA
jgi:hypothetical protein